MFPPISESPPPPIDRDALRAEAVRVRRRRAARAALLALILASSFGTVWVLSSGEIPSRSEWAFSATQVEVLQRRGLDGRGVTICLADTGIDAGHPALRGAPVLAWRDFVDGRVRPYDDDGHGTGMAGLLVGRGPLRGVAPAASLIVAKVLDSRGRGTSASLAAAIGFCVDPNGDGDASDGAAIVSLSLAAAQDLPAGTDVEDAVARALLRGVFIVASAGNDGAADDGDVQRPASIPDVIAVGAVDAFSVVARFSSMGTDAGRADPNRKPEVVAPGVDLLTASRADTYRLVSGTSASAAVVSGILALILQEYPALSKAGSPSGVATLKAALMASARRTPFQVAPHDARYGYGIVQAADLAEAL